MTRSLPLAATTRAAVRVAPAPGRDAATQRGVHDPQRIVTRDRTPVFREKNSRREKAGGAHANLRGRSFRRVERLLIRRWVLARSFRKARCVATRNDGSPCEAWAVNGSARCVAHLGRNGRPRTAAPPDERQLKQLCAALAAGATLTAAAGACGVSRHAVAGWLREDDAVRRRVSEARAAAEQDHLAQVLRAARRGNVAASTWLLERRWPERWAEPPRRLVPTPVSAARLSVAAADVRGTPDADGRLPPSSRVLSPAAARNVLREQLGLDPLDGGAA